MENDVQFYPPTIGSFSGTTVLSKFELSGFEIGDWNV